MLRSLLGIAGDAAAPAYAELYAKNHGLLLHLATLGINRINTINSMRKFSSEKSTGIKVTMLKELSVMIYPAPSLMGESVTERLAKS